MEEKKIKAAIVSELTENCLATWKDDGERRQYEDLDVSEANEIANGIINRLSTPSVEGETCKDCEVLPGRCAICEGRDKPKYSIEDLRAVAKDVLEINSVLQSNSGETTVSDEEMKKLVKLVFDAGVKCHSLHPDDDSYDIVHFDAVFKRIKKRLTTKRESERERAVRFAEWYYRNCIAQNRYDITMRSTDELYTIFINQDK